MIAIDRQGLITVWNVGAQRLFGHSEQEMLGHNLETIFTSDDRQAARFTTEMRLALRDGRAGDDRWHVRRDGSLFWGSGLMMPLAVPGTGFVKIVRDRTRERLAEERLRDSEKRFRTLVEGMPQLVWRSCNQGKWTWASPQWCDFTGQTQEESRDHGWLDAVHPDDRAATVQAWREALPTGLLDVEFRVRHAVDHDWVWHHTRSLPVRDAKGGVVEWLGTTTDIRMLKELQQRQQALLGQVRQHAEDLENEVDSAARQKPSCSTRRSTTT